MLSVALKLFILFDMSMSFGCFIRELLISTEYYSVESTELYSGFQAQTE